jgi:phosphate transport system substrate-binding protein
MKNTNEIAQEKHMRPKFYALIALLAAASLLLGACSPTVQAAPTSQVIENTVIVQGTPVVITATPGPSTAQSTSLPAGSVQINGAGSTFAFPIYSQWTYAYQYVDPSVAINYQGTGSGAGKTAIINGTVDFAGTDSLVSDAEYASGKDLQMYPILAGAVVPVYNIKFANVPANTTLPALILDGNTLVGIYNATITNWNDPAIAAINPDLKAYLPDAKITAVHRSDGSGTTELFTKALSAFSTAWTAGGASSVQWPIDKAGNGVGGKGNPGVAAIVQNTANSIGYVELSYAISNNIPFASMVNKAGKQVTANGASVQSAMNDFATTFTPQLTNTIVNAPGDGSWPITGYTYMILHTSSMTDCTKAQKLLEYIKWTLTDAGAAQVATKLGYSVLPAAAQQMVLAKLAEVTCSGSPVLK